MTKQAKQSKPGRSHTSLITDPGIKSRIKATRETGGWEPTTKTWMAMDFGRLSEVSQGALYPILDFITAAVEEGVLTAENIFPEAFRDLSDWERFIADLEDYPFWINERWYYVLREVQLLWEDDRVFEDVAATMRKALAEWRAKKKVSTAARARRSHSKTTRKAKEAQRQIGKD